MYFKLSRAGSSDDLAKIGSRSKVQVCKYHRW